MFDFIEKLRQKPEKTKRRIVFLTSFSIVGIIFVIWLSVVFSDFRKEDNLSNDPARGSSPLTSLSNFFSNSVSSIGEEIYQVKELGANIYESILSSSTPTSSPIYPDTLGGEAGPMD